MSKIKDAFWDEICDMDRLCLPRYVKMEPQTPVEKMKSYLGKNWVLHPEYQFRPRHSNDVTIWQKHSVLSEVRAAAVAAGRLS